MSSIHSKLIHATNYEIDSLDCDSMDHKLIIPNIPIKINEIIHPIIFYLKKISFDHLMNSFFIVFKDMDIYKKVFFEWINSYTFADDAYIVHGLFDNVLIKIYEIRPYDMLPSAFGKDKLIKVQFYFDHYTINLTEEDNKYLSILMNKEEFFKEEEFLIN